MRGESWASKEGNKHSSEICIESPAFFFLKGWFKGKQKAFLGSISEKNKHVSGKNSVALQQWKFNDIRSKSSVRGEIRQQRFFFSVQHIIVWLVC